MCVCARMCVCVCVCVCVHVSECGVRLCVCVCVCEQVGSAFVCVRVLHTCTHLCQAAVTFIRTHSAAQNAIVRMQSANSKKITALLFRVANETRWNSTFYMIQRYIFLSPAIQKLLGCIAAGEETDIPGLSAVLPSHELLQALRACVPVRYCVCMCVCVCVCGVWCVCCGYLYCQ